MNRLFQRDWRSSVRTTAAIFLGALVLILSGCVYLRLFELKNQLAKFDQYFAVDQRDGVKLTLLEPVLLDEDVTFLKLVPEQRERVGSAERWQFRWVKANPSPSEEARSFDITAEFMFSQHKLSRVVLPEKLFVFFPKPFFLEMLRAVGGAKIDRAKREASINYSADHVGGGVTLMPEDQILAVLGSPSEKIPTATGVDWRYRYEKATPDQHSGNIDITISFDPVDHRMTRLRGKILSGAVDFKFRPDSGQPTVP